MKRIFTALVLLFIVASPALALNPGNYPYFTHGAIDISVMVDTSIKHAILNMGGQIKDATGTGESSIMEALMTASMATEWFAVRSVLFGVTGIEKVGDVVSSGKMEEYKQMIAVGYVYNILKNYTGDQGNVDEGKKSIAEQAMEKVDSWDGKDAASLFADLKPLILQVHDVGSSLDMYAGSGSAGNKYANLMAPISKDMIRLEAIASTAKRMKGIPGIDSASGSLYDRMNVVGFSLLGIALLVQLVWAMFLYSKGDYKENVGSIVIKYITVVFVMIAVPHIVLFGISIADSIKDLILNPGGGKGSVEQYRALQLALEMRTTASGIANSSWSVTSALTNGITYLISVLAQAVIYILLILGDVMMAISILAAPLVIPLSLLPSFQDYLSKWFKGITTFLMYPIAAAMYSVLLSSLILAQMEASVLTILIISICYLMGALKIPNIAEQMNGAVMASMAAGIAAAPMKAAGAALGNAGGVAGGAIGGAAKAAGKSVNT